mgnify:CR=1 FL=1
MEILNFLVENLSREMRLVLMVTYSDLFLFGTLIIGVITLVYNITKKK